MGFGRFSSAVTTLTTAIEATAPRSRPSLRSKPWWTPLLATLRKEFTKASHLAKKSRTPDTFLIARQSKLGYFKAIKKAKASYWADCLAKTSPNNIWAAKQLVAPRKTRGSPPSLTPQTQSPSTKHCLISSSHPKTPYRAEAG